MYPKRQRLRFGKNRFKAEAVMRSRSFSVKVAQSGGAGNKFAIIISKAAAKKATKRNFWKRIIAEEIRKWPNSQKSFLIVAFPKIDDATPKEVREELRAIAEKIE